MFRLTHLFPAENAGFGDFDNARFRLDDRDQVGKKTMQRGANRGLTPPARHSF
jgi:hypothetical protein